MAQPLFDLFHRYAVCQQKRGARVAKIVEPNVPHIISSEQLPKGRGYIVGFYEVADHIDTDIAQILLVVGASAQLSVFLLLFLSLQ